MVTCVKQGSDLLRKTAVLKSNYMNATYSFMQPSKQDSTKNVVYSFTQPEQDLTTIVLLGDEYDVYCKEDELRDMVVGQDLSEKIEEKFGKDNILMKVSVNDRSSEKKKPIALGR